MKLTPFHAATSKQLAVAIGVLCSILALWFLIAAWSSAVDPAVRRSTGWMSPGTALCLLLSSAGLLLVMLGPYRWAKGLARAVALTMALLSGLSLVHDYAGLGSGALWMALGMAPNSALAFLLLAIALSCLPCKHGSLGCTSQGLPIAAMALALFAFVQHLYDNDPLLAPSSPGTTSVPAAVGIALAALGIFAARFDLGVPSIFTSPGPGGSLARRMLLPFLFAPIAIGWLVLEGSRMGLRPTSSTLALLVTAVAMAELGLGLLLAIRLDRLGVKHAQLLDESRGAREALQQAEERLRLTLECGAIGAWHYDPRTDLISANARCLEMFSLPRQDHKSEAYFARLHPADRPRVEAAMRRSLDHESGGSYDVEYRVLAEPESERWIRATGQAFFDERGRPEQMFGTVSDITDHKLARQNAEAASRAKDAFLAVLGHELRNPLSPILTALELMKLRGDTAFSHERNVIERQVQHMVRLVDDLLDVSRIARGKIELKRRRVEIASVVDRSIELTSSLFEQRRHTLRVDVPQHGLVVYGDEHRLVQVLSNLLTNAAKYTPQGGTIDIRVRANEANVSILVRDNGVGIPDDLRPRLFDTFAQGPRIIERSQGGLGLGLSIAKSLIELHGGSIGVESAGAGRGSEFTVSLPLENAVDQIEPMSTRTAVAALSRKRAQHVLVVDDNPDTAETLAEILRFDEHEVSIAYDGPSALALAKEQPFDLAFLDIGLPVMDGYELARQIRRLRRGDEIVLVAVTGYARDADRRRSEAAGFDEHLVKPVEPVQVLSIAADPAQCSLGHREREAHPSALEQSP